MLFPENAKVLRCENVFGFLSDLPNFHLLVFFFGEVAQRAFRAMIQKVGRFARAWYHGSVVFL